jgi:4a-hydroxytetrahydrobiopterin dehydratase
MRLNENEISQRLKNLRGWSVKENKLRKTFTFQNFKNAIEFINKIQPIADSMNHHPDICIFYNKVIIELTTHDEGGITEKDFELARRIEEISS